MTTPEEQLTASAQENKASLNKMNTQWLIGGLLTLIPLCIIIYFIFFWSDSQQKSPAQSNETILSSPQVPQAAYDIPSSEPVFDSPINKEVPKNKLTEYQNRQQAGSANAPLKAKPLPSLAQSDDHALDELSSLSPLLEWYIWLYTDEVVRKFVTVIDNVARGKVVTKYISIPRPAERFKPAIRQNELHLDQNNFDRYRVYADVFDSLNTEQVVALYWRYMPLMEEAYRELGYPQEQSFHKTMLKAIDNLLEAPVINDPIAVVPLTPVLFKFADPELEELPQAYKQLLRMGPRNTLVIMRKLEQVKMQMDRTQPAK